MLLKNMSLDPREYGWTVGVNGYEPVPTLWHLMSHSHSHTVIVVETAATDDVAARRMMSSASQQVEIVKVLHAKIVSIDGLQSGDDSDQDVKTFVEVVKTLCTIKSTKNITLTE